ncbi:hypothetical protein DFH09DRAFT_1229791 [Mycena vulgaris]|nr:hypothetical protein DFH09DRAFT_1229791 [Mycena vulgaris]
MSESPMDITSPSTSRFPDSDCDASLASRSFCCSNASGWTSNSTGTSSGIIPSSSMSAVIFFFFDCLGRPVATLVFWVTRTTPDELVFASAMSMASSALSSLIFLFPEATCLAFSIALVGITRNIVKIGIHAGGRSWVNNNRVDIHFTDGGVQVIQVFSVTEPFLEVIEVDPAGVGEQLRVL